jgi:hypothetical protein
VATLTVRFIFLGAKGTVSQSLQRLLRTVRNILDYAAAVSGFAKLPEDLQVATAAPKSIGWT